MKRIIERRHRDKDLLLLLVNVNVNEDFRVLDDES